MVSGGHERANTDRCGGRRFTAEVEYRRHPEEAGRPRLTPSACATPRGRVAFSWGGFGNERNLRTMMGLLALYHNRITDRSYGLEYAAGWRRTEPSY